MCVCVCVYLVFLLARTSCNGSLGLSSVAVYSCCVCVCVHVTMQCVYTQYCMHLKIIYTHNPAHAQMTGVLTKLRHPNKQHCSQHHPTVTIQ